MPALQPIDELLPGGFYRGELGVRRGAAEFGDGPSLQARAVLTHPDPLLPYPKGSEAAREPGTGQRPGGSPHVCTPRPSLLPGEPHF